MISNQSSTCNRFKMQFTQNTQNTQKTQTSSYITSPPSSLPQTHTTMSIRLSATMNDVLYTPVLGRKCSSCGDRKK